MLERAAVLRGTTGEAEAMAEIEVGMRAVGTAGELEPVEDLEEAILELEAPETLAEELEELEPLASFIPLPPEPIEQLEFLPEASIAAAQEAAPGVDASPKGRPLPMAAVDTIETPEIVDLLRRKEVSIYAMREVLRMVPEPSEAIVEEGGVYRISEQAYSAVPGSERGELRSLATAVLGRQAGGAKPPPGKRRALVSPAGLDYDDYLDQFPKPLTDRVVFRSLIAISQDISAVGVILLGDREGRYEPLLNIGVDDVTLSRFRFAGDDPICVDVLRKRKALIVHKPIADVEPLRGKVSSEDAAYIKRALLLPATYRRSSAFLFFAFARDANVVLRELFSALNAEAAPQRPF